MLGTMALTATTTVTLAKNTGKDVTAKKRIITYKLLYSIKRVDCKSDGHIQLRLTMLAFINPVLAPPILVDSSRVVRSWSWREKY